MPGKMLQFSRPTQRVLAAAMEEAERYQHGLIAPIHLLLGMVRNDSSTAGRVLSSLGIKEDRTRQSFEALIAILPWPKAEKVDLSPETKRVLEIAVDEARRLHADKLRTGHLLLGLIALGENPANILLEQLGVDPAKIKTQVLDILTPLQDAKARVYMREIALNRSAPADSEEKPQTPYEELKPSTSIRNMERFTQRARRVLSLAQETAERYQHSYIGTEHLLLGLFYEDGGLAGRVLRELKINQHDLESVILRITRASQRSGYGRLDLSPGTKRVLELAVDESRRMGHHYINTEHLLLGLVRLNEGIALQVLKLLNVTPEEVRRKMRQLLQEPPRPAPNESSTPEPPKEE